MFKNRNPWLFILGCSLQLSLSAQSIEQVPISLTQESVNLTMILNQIATRYDIPFYFDPSLLPEKELSITFEEQALREVLKSLLEEHELSYLVYQNRGIIILSQVKKKELGNYSKQFYAALEGRLQEGKAPTEVISIGAEQPSEAGVTPTIVGRLADAATGEPIVGATIYWPELEEGTVTDSRGLWEVKIPTGEYRLQIQYIGYNNFERTFAILGDGFLDMKLRQEAFDLATVIVLAEANDDNVTRDQAGLSTISVRRIEELPAFLGEADVVQTILTDAGVSSIGEGATGFNVRGGTVDQNLILQGGSILFNSAHALGFFSVINPAIIEDVSLYKSILPAEYGGRLSSVLAVDLRRGNQEQWTASGGLSPLTAKLSVEGPFADGNGSILASGRYAYSDWVLKQVNRLEVERSTAGFFDANLLLNYDLSERSELRLSLYGSGDSFVYNQDFGFDYNTRSIELGLLHELRSGLTSDFSLVANRFFSEQQELSGAGSGTLSSGITYYKAKEQLNWESGEAWKATAGLEAILYQLPGQAQAPLGATSILPIIELEDERGLETALFGEITWEPLTDLSIKAGLRLNSYQYLGGRSLLAYAEEGIYDLSTVVDTLTYGNGEVIENYRTLEPRVSLRYQLAESQSIRGGYSRTSQFVNQVFNTDTPTPQSRYQLSTPYIKPFLAHNFSLGYFHNFRKNKWETSIEGFYRAIDQLWDYRDFARLNLNSHLETELLEGQGRAYGLEVAIKAHAVRLDGQFSYTWSRTENQVAGVNQSNWYPNYFDQPNQVSGADFALY
ncbi:MAG: TonB-dependent receptor, partial [Bacteroidota bacterium]